MNEELTLTNRNYIKQHYTIINAKYALSINEIDIILILLTAIKNEDEDFKDYSFTKKDLENKTDKKWNSHQLKNTIKSLMNKSLEFKNEKNKWTIVNWFSYFKYDEGLITCRFDKFLKPFFLDVRGQFVLSNIKYLLRMKSSYSKRIYLMLQEYKRFGRRKFNVKELQDILKVPKSMESYSSFNQKVLSRAVKDINKFTDLEVSFDEHKKGRKIDAITFKIKKNFSDLKSFIQYIRELYINEPLYKTKDNRILKCSAKGLLYYADMIDGACINQKESQKLWEYLHENRENLIVFKKNQFELEESLKRLKDSYKNS